MDLVYDRPALGSELRILTIVDTHSRFCPAAAPCFTYRDGNVVQTLEQFCAQVGYPKTMRIDNGGELRLPLCGSSLKTGGMTAIIHLPVESASLEY